MRRLLALAFLCMQVAACEDPALRAKADSLGPDPGPYEDGPLHRAGQPCTWCHSSGGGRNPHFDLAGTVYGHWDKSDGLWGATVRLFDQHGAQQTVTSNEVGTFFLGEGELTLEFPLWVQVEYGGTITSMKTPIMRERSCSACHLDPAGPGSPGHVFFHKPPANRP